MTKSTKLYQFRAPEKIQQLVTELQRLTGVDSGADVVRDALCYYNWIIEELQRGNEVMSYDKDSKTYTKLANVVQPHIVK